MHLKHFLNAALHLEVKDVQFRVEIGMGTGGKNSKKIWLQREDLPRKDGV